MMRFSRPRTMKCNYVSLLTVFSPSMTLWLLLFKDKCSLPQIHLDFNGSARKWSAAVCWLVLPGLHWWWVLLTWLRFAGFAGTQISPVSTFKKKRKLFIASLLVYYYFWQIFYIFYYALCCCNMVNVPIEGIKKDYLIIRLKTPIYIPVIFLSNFFFFTLQNTYSIITD